MKDIEFILKLFVSKHIVDKSPFWPFVYAKRVFLNYNL